MSDFESVWIDVKQHGGTQTVCCPAHDDTTPSCSLWLNAKDKVGVKCHSHDCDPDEIYNALGWLTLYDYKNERGELLYQTRRVDFPNGSKELCQRRRVGTKGWIWDLQGVTPCLYNLPAVLGSETVYIVEGEKCAEALIKQGLTATTNPLGANNWRNSYSGPLRGKAVLLIPDNDDPGHRHIEKVAKSVAKIAESVKILELPGLKDKEDVYDWLEAGHTTQELDTLADEAEEYKLPSNEEAVSLQGQTKSRRGERPKTELGNAERFADEYSNQLRFVSELKSWIEYDGSRFRFVSEERAYQLMKAIVRCIDCETVTAESEEVKAGLRKWATMSEKKSVLSNSLSLAEKEERLTVSAGDLDCDPWLITVQNGTIDLRNGELRRSSTEDLITKQVPVLFDPAATCPRWIKFLERVIPDSDLRLYLQKATGYSLTGLTSEQVLFFLYGPGANGKSKFIGVLEALLSDYWAKMRADLLMLSRNGPNRGATPELVYLKGKRIVTVSEIQNGHRLDEALIKDLTGGDAITARDLFAKPITFLPNFKIWMYGNHKPNIGNTDEGIWRRPKLIPFLEVIPLAEREGDLLDKLLAELPGIFNWALEGCRLWQKDGLGEPALIAEATQEYREEQDILGVFLAEMCEENAGAKVKVAAIYEAYKLWCKDNTVYTHSGIKFGKSLSERGFGTGTPGGVRWRLGLRLTEEAIKRAGLNSNSNG